jgi:hypothetical protein
VNAKYKDGRTPLDFSIAFKQNNNKSATSSANTAARPRGNWKLKGNETTTNNNRSRGAGGVRGVAAVKAVV